MKGHLLGISGSCFMLHEVNIASLFFPLKIRNGKKALGLFFSPFSVAKIKVSPPSFAFLEMADMSTYRDTFAEYADAAWDEVDRTRKDNRAEERTNEGKWHPLIWFFGIDQRLEVRHRGRGNHLAHGTDAKTEGSFRERDTWRPPTTSPVPP